MTKNGVKTRPEVASVAGKKLKDSPNKVMQKLAATALVNAKKDSNPKKKK